MSTTPSSSFSDQPDEQKKKSFACCICMDTPTDPVLTPCGHLFCWSCLDNWLEMNHDDCPVCRGKVTKENVTPIYGAGDEEKDPRKTEKHDRPKAHYEESDHSRNARNPFNFFGFPGFGLPGFFSVNFGNSSFSFGGSPFFLLSVLSSLFSQLRSFLSVNEETSSDESTEPELSNGGAWLVIA
ncbi:hypothetical protein WA588_005680, partial [Blastocystis sp. NMH]